MRPPDCFTWLRSVLWVPSVRCRCWLRDRKGTRPLYETCAIYPHRIFFSTTEGRLEKPSLEVAPTTLWLVLLICSFQFRSALCFSATLLDLVFPVSCTLSLSAEKETFSCRDLERWPMTLTYELDLYKVKVIYRDMYVGQLSCEHTHSRPTAVPGPPDWLMTRAQ